MICPNCNQTIPDDSQFCHFCGSTIDLTPAISDSQPELLETKKDADAKTKRTSKYLIIGLAVLSLVLAGLNIFQYTDNLSKQSEKDATILSLQDENDSQKQKLAEKEKTIANQTKPVSAYKKIVETVNSDSFFSSSNYFYVDKYIVCLKPGQQKKINLTTTWSGGGYVTVDSSSNNAYINFDEETWINYTTLTVGANSYLSALPYVNVFTFTNDVDSTTFKVLAIITE